MFDCSGNICGGRSAWIPIAIRDRFGKDFERKQNL